MSFGCRSSCFGSESYYYECPVLSIEYYVNHTSTTNVLACTLHEYLYYVNHTSTTHFLACTLHEYLYYVNHTSTTNVLACTLHEYLYCAVCGMHMYVESDLP